MLPSRSLHLADCERTVRDWAGDFSAAYVAVNRLADAIRENPARADHRTVAALAGIIHRSDHLDQTHGQRLFQSAAGGLTAVMTGTPDTRLANHVREVMNRALRNGSGVQIKGVSAAMGALPLDLCGPDIGPVSGQVPAAPVDIATLAPGPWRRRGRSLVSPTATPGQVMVVKMAEAAGLRRLGLEARWMNWLLDHRRRFVDRFDIPEPVAIGDGYLFRPKGMPAAVRVPDPAGAIAFAVSADYFVYPTEHLEGRYPAPAEVMAMLGRCARLLGTLTAMGILHNAPIPLFHNRMQQARREDRGRYEWERGGRLDRWLTSSRYPNFGLSGIRDFEHLTACRPNDPRLYTIIGSHLISFVLVAGSYFRRRDPQQVGFASTGRPVDARHLFDPALFADMLSIIFGDYHLGFAGDEPGPGVPGMGPDLVHRLIEEMGVDRHMTEILRVHDQQAMTDAEFQHMLTFARDAGSNGPVMRGEADIDIITGPHLGEFNSVISVPELIEFAAAGAAACIVGRYWRDRGRRQSP